MINIVKVLNTRYYETFFFTYSDIFKCPYLIL